MTVSVAPLDCDVAIKPRIARAIHLPHTANPKGGEDLIRPEASAGGKRQTLPVGLYGRAPASPGSPRSGHAIFGDHRLNRRMVFDGGERGGLIHERHAGWVGLKGTFEMTCRGQRLTKDAVEAR